MDDNKNTSNITTSNLLSAKQRAEERLQKLIDKKESQELINGGRYVVKMLAEEINKRDKNTINN